MYFSRAGSQGLGEGRAGWAGRTVYEVWLVLCGLAVGPCGSYRCLCRVAYHPLMPPTFGLPPEAWGSGPVDPGEPFVRYG